MVSTCFNPFQKYAQVKLDPFPPIFGVKIKKKIFELETTTEKWLPPQKTTTRWTQQDTKLQVGLTMWIFPPKMRDFWAAPVDWSDGTPYWSPMCFNRLNCLVQVSWSTAPMTNLYSMSGKHNHYCPELFGVCFCYQQNTNKQKPHGMTLILE